MKIDPVQLSKFLSLILRHKPETIGLAMDNQGWARIDELISRSQLHIQFDRNDLNHIVETSDKRRFTISADGERIRAAQGHSYKVDLGLAESEPPSRLYHGTATRFLDAILRDGLIAQSRTHVHLSSEIAAAIEVGRRHGRPAVLNIDAYKMHVRGLKFYLADNGVWLTNHVPPEFLTVSSTDDDSAINSTQPRSSR